MEHDFTFGPQGPYRSAPARSWRRLFVRLALPVVLGVSFGLLLKVYL